ncbi:HpcH/HpaI aldolase/citrate lyase family protein [bacterium]|nr:HpcH/HpaI aldolase/citrate lyase family protein [bacterium]
MTKAPVTAGRKGSDVRSDAWMELRPLDGEKCQITLEGKASDLHNQSTLELLHRGLERFKLEGVHLHVIDQGALPFVLMARLEAVARKWDSSTNTTFLPDQFAEFKGSVRSRSRRSRLYIPGNEPKFMINASLHEPDGLILDLEDSVAMAQKDEARVLVRNALIHLDFKISEKIVRINQGERGLADLEWVIPYGVQLILIPKVESPQQIHAVAERADELVKNAGISYPVWLMPIIESAKGAWFAYDIASAHPNIVAMAIGLEDYTADIGAQRTDKGTESFWARAQVLNAARAAGVQPIDTVFSDVGDMEGLTASVLEAKSLGFEGKGCIHPRQIPVVRQAFAPTEAEINKAKKIAIAFENAEKRGLGAVSLGTKMIDPPVVKRALKTIQLALEEGLLPDNWKEIE